MKQYEKNRGISSIVGLFLFVIILLLAASMFDLQGLVEKPQTQKNVAYVKENSESLWKSYLEKPAFYIWNNIFLNLIWGAFTENMEAIKKGVPTSLEQSAPIIAVPYQEGATERERKNQQVIPKDNY